MAGRFFMNLRYRGRLFRDDEGDELGSLDAAREHALTTASDMIRRTRTKIIRDWFDCAFEITDDSGETLITVPFGDTISQ